MPDNHDPRFPARPGDQNSETPDGQDPKADDPLVELARIVSGRSGPAGAPGAAEEPAPAAPAAADPGKTDPLPSESDLARDLEEELLNELQASFSMVPEVSQQPSPPQASQRPAQPQPQPAAAPPPPASPEPPPAPLPPLSADPVAQAPTRPDVVAPRPEEPPPVAREPEAPFFASGAAPDVDPVSAPQATAPAPPPVQPPAERRQPVPPQAQAEPDPTPDRLEGWLAQSPPPKRPTLADRIAHAARIVEREAQPVPQEVEPQPAPPEPTARAPRPPAPERRREADGREGSQLRGAAAPHRSDGEPEGATRRGHSRWDPPPGSELDPPIDATRFAPASSESFRPPGSEPPPEPDPFADEFPFPDDDAEAHFGEIGEDGDHGTVPGYGDDEELLGYSDEELAAIEPPRSRRAPLAVAALIAIAVIVGGIIMVLLRAGGSGDPPPVITADASPTKIAPENTGSSEGDASTKLIYDRVDPNSEVADSQLVVPNDQPIADIPPIPEETAGGEVSRVILEGGPAVDSPRDNADSPQTGGVPEPSGTTIASSAPESGQIGPKKVRTVVVRPDGTIVSNEVAEADPSAPTAQPQEPQIADLPPASETPPAPAADENPLLSDNFGSEVIEGSVPDVAAAAPSPSVPDVPAPAPSVSEPPPVPVVRAPPPNPTVVATPGSSNGPIDVTPGTPAPSSSAGRGGGFLVQVSSQRSREVALASFAELQQRYPGILGDRAPDIQRADLGERGVYYRVRVGYPTREEAIRMCENLKAAGGDCLLASR